LLWTILIEAGKNWSKHKDSRQGAAIAYYSVFSLGPIIVIAIAVAGFFFGKDAVNGQVASSIKDTLGSTGAEAVEAMLASASRPRQGLIATVLGVVTVIFAALGVVVQLKDALNTVWETSDAPGLGVWRFIRDYVVSVAAVLALGFLLIASLLVTAGLAALGNYAGSHVEPALSHFITGLTSFSIATLLFAMMFKWLPDAPVDWYDVWLGAIVTAVLFEAGQFAIGFYIGKEGIASTYGIASSIIVVLSWVYYSSQIVLMGAEITYAFAKHDGSLKQRVSTP